MENSQCAHDYVVVIGDICRCVHCDRRVSAMAALTYTKAFFLQALGDAGAELSAKEQALADLEESLAKISQRLELISERLVDETTLKRFYKSWIHDAGYEIPEKGGEDA